MNSCQTMGIKAHTNPSRIEGFWRLPINRRGFFTKEIQSRASSAIRATITGNSSNVFLSLVSKVSGGSMELKRVADRTVV